MTSPIPVTRGEARRFMLWYQGLLGPRKGDVMNWVGRLGAVQFDPLNPFMRSAELTLAARVEAFTPDKLAHELYDTRRLMDGWDKCMCIYPTERYPLFAQERSRIRDQVPPERQPLLQQARALLQARGTLTAAELTEALRLTGNAPGPGGAWNSGSLGKVLLETLYTTGEAVIEGKRGNAKRYGPAQGHIPQGVLEAPDPFDGDGEAWLEQRIFDRIRGFGILWDKSGDGWLGIHGAGRSAARQRALEQLTAQGRLACVSVDGVTAYVQAGDAPLIPLIPGGGGRVELLAPLDNLLWDRKWAAWLFDFDYTWEVYKPARQRRYGYYVLPVLAEDHFAGRIEPWLNRDTGLVEVRGLWWESGREQQRYETALRARLEELAASCGAKGVRWPR